MRQSLCLLFTFAAVIALGVACGASETDPAGSSGGQDETAAGEPNPAEAQAKPSHHVTYYMLNKG